MQGVPFLGGNLYIYRRVTGNMKLYLSSYKLGNEVEKLKALVPKNNKTGYIPNALDGSKWSEEDRTDHIGSDMDDLKAIGLDVELLDLQDYFGKKEALQKKVDELGVVWVGGGNTFVLRQAMKLSGFDDILKQLVGRKDFLYGAYSAGVCVLSPSLKVYAITDDATAMPYSGIKEVVWEGIGLLDYVVEPHYASDHPESKSTDKEIKYCISNKILFKALRDGEVIIIE